MGINIIPSFLRAAVDLIRRKASMRTGKEIKELSKEPVMLISLRNLLLTRFYLRNSPTLFSILLSGKDKGPVLRTLNNLVGQKSRFDYIHTLTPQFTIGELQQHTSVDTYFLMESSTLLGIIDEISSSIDLEYRAGEPSYCIWKGTDGDAGSGNIYFIDQSGNAPVIPCLDNITSNEHHTLNATQTVSMLMADPVSLLICRKWHFKELSDTLTSSSLPELLN